VTWSCYCLFYLILSGCATLSASSETRECILGKGSIWGRFRVNNLDFWISLKSTAYWCQRRVDIRSPKKKSCRTQFRRRFHVSKKINIKFTSIRLEIDCISASILSRTRGKRDQDDLFNLHFIVMSISSRFQVDHSSFMTDQESTLYRRRYWVDITST